MMILPITLVIITSVIFLAVFVLRFPVEELYMPRTALLDPVLLVKAAGDFLRANPLAIGYIFLWALICVLIFAVTTTVITRRMAQKITRSLDELTRAADRVRGGNLSFEIIGSDMEEIDALCTSFDDMRRALLSALSREEKLRHERSMLIANISHDLKTPITSIKGYIDAVNDGVADDYEKLSRYLRIIKSKANSIENLVGNLSTMSRLELSRLEMTFERGELNDLLYDAAADHRIDAELAGLEISAELAPESTEVSIDYEKMRRVFINLIENSIKYRRPVSRKIIIRSETAADGVYARVIDDGIGIEPDQIPKIYESFYRIDEARASAVKGNGLGLGIAKQIVQKHGGRLWITSDGAGKGCTANVFIPWREKNEKDINN